VHRVLSRFTSKREYLPVSLLIIIASIVLGTLFSYAQAKGNSPDIFSLSSSPYGTSYGNWLSRYWQWSIGIPAAQHPFTSYSPERCTLHQNGPVWFLPDVPESKQIVIHNCTIPSGKAVLFTVETGECDFGTPDLKTDKDLVDCATAGNVPQFIVMRAAVDGSEIENVKQYRVLSNFFNLTFPQDNIYEVKPGTYRAITSGYVIILKPLAVGKHVITYSDQVNNPKELSYNHQKSVQYDITVIP
jgi:hypothetical protein